MDQKEFIPETQQHIDLPEADTEQEYEEADPSNPKYKLEIFEGPLDLLLSLISKNKVNIYDIPIALIFDQYMEYIDKMKLFNMEIASEFIVMASQLMLIKSRLLLPRHDEEDAQDPRAELVDMLLEYKRAKAASGILHERELNFWGRYEKPAEKIEISPEYTLTHDIEILRNAFLTVFERVKNSDDNLNDMKDDLGKHLTATRKVSVGERIIHVMKRLTKKKSSFYTLFDDVKTKSEAVATFLALLELIKGMRVRVTYNNESFTDCEIELIREKNSEG